MLSKSETKSVTIRELVKRLLQVAWYGDLLKREDKEEIIDRAVDKILDSSVLEIDGKGVLSLQKSKQAPGKALESWGKEKKEVAWYVSFYINQSLDEFFNPGLYDTSIWQLKSFTNEKDLGVEVAKIYKKLGILPAVLMGDKIPPYRLYAIDNQTKDRVYTPLNDIRNFPTIHFEFDEREYIKNLINTKKGSSQE